MPASIAEGRIQISPGRTVGVIQPQMKADDDHRDAEAQTLSPAFLRDVSGPELEGVLDLMEQQCEALSI